MMRLIKKLRFFLVLSVLLPVSSVFALTNNTQPLMVNGAPVVEHPLVQHAKVMTITSDYAMSGAIIWRLTTTDTNNAANNECNSTSNTSYVNFYINAELAASDNKLQKLMSMLQVAQLTNMQVTLMGAPLHKVTPARKCSTV